jgi:hypothetical protein
VTTKFEAKLGKGAGSAFTVSPMSGTVGGYLDQSGCSDTHAAATVERTSHLPSLH